MSEGNKLYVVGIGPGAYDQMTIKAEKALNKSDVIVGYMVYVDLVREYFPNKEYYSTPMTQETERCRKAFEYADTGRTVSIVSSGDSGIYGMAGLILEMAPDYPDVDIEIIPGVTAASAGAAILGAPIGHDFAVISLSDLLTSKDLIRQRLEECAKADMAICIYNPGSSRRTDHLRWACEVVGQFRDPHTVCGIARNIARDGEEYKILPLYALKDETADMFTTVFIGNSTTRCIEGRMVTPRGYKDV